MNGNSYRLFTAVPLPENVKRSLAEWGAAHKSSYSFQKWAHRDDLHITLFFMGDTEEKALPKIKNALQDITASHSPFELRLNGLGTFGPPAAPSILWTGLEGGRERLSDLHRDVQHALVRVGYTKEDKSFRPHITLARRYNGGTPWTQLRDKLTGSFPLDGTEFTVDRFILYRSHLGRSPMYEAVEEFKLPVLTMT